MKKLLTVLTIIFVMGLVFVPVVAQDTEAPSAEETAEDIVDLTVDAAESTALSLENFLERLMTPPQSDLTRVLMVVGGIILLVAGWRVYDFIIVIAGFLMGASVAMALVVTESTFIAIAAFLIGGLIGAALAIFVYFLAVFLIGAYVGIVLTGSLASALALTPVSSLALIIGAIIGGILLTMLSFELLVVLSAVVGAQLVTLALGLNAVWTLVLAVAGIIFQFLLMQRFDYEFRRRRSPRNRLFAR